MIGPWARRWSGPLLDAAAGPLERLGLTPNQVTLLGAVAMFAAAGVLAVAPLAWGGVALAVAAFLDALDGALARRTGQISPFGAFLDSTLDRWAEIAVYLGLLYRFRTDATVVILIYLALAGSVMVSYTRARSEGVAIPTQAGWFARLERIGILVVGLLLGPSLLPWALALIAAGSVLTAIQRLLDVHGTASG